MKFRVIVAWVTGVPLLAAAPPQPVRLQPSSQWIVDYAENSCRLIRTFGGDGSKTVFVLESPGPGAIDLLVVGKPLGDNYEEASAKFLPGDNKPFTGRAATSSKSGQPAILWSNVPLLPEPARELAETAAKKAKPKPGVRPPPIDLRERAAARAARQAFAAATTELEIDSHRKHPVILETGSLRDPIKLFDQCTRDSLRDWGVDPDLEDKIVRPAWTPNPSRWFDASDYPQDMVTQGKQSEVSARLLLDASGRVTSCTSLSHFDAPEFNKAVCDNLRTHARFEPAELADGMKVPSYYTLRVVFRIAH